MKKTISVLSSADDKLRIDFLKSVLNGRFDEAVKILDAQNLRDRWRLIMSKTRSSNKNILQLLGSYLTKPQNKKNLSSESRVFQNMRIFCDRIKSHGQELLQADGVYTELKTNGAFQHILTLLELEEGKLGYSAVITAPMRHRFLFRHFFGQNSKLAPKVLVLGPGIYNDELITHDIAGNICKYPKQDFFSPMIAELATIAKSPEIDAVDESAPALEAAEKSLLRALPYENEFKEEIGFFGEGQGKVRTHNHCLEWSKTSFSQLPKIENGYDFLLATYVLTYPMVSRCSERGYGFDRNKQSVQVMVELLDRLAVDGKLVVDANTASIFAFGKSVDASLDSIAKKFFGEFSDHVAGNFKEKLFGVSCMDCNAVTGSYVFVYRAE